MANEDVKDEQGGKKKSKLMLIIIIAVVLLVGGGGAAYFFLFMGDETASEEESAVESDADELGFPSQNTAVYVGMPRPFVFNAPGMSRERIVQIEVQLMVRGSINEELAKRHIPMIEGSLLQVFSASNADDLVTEAGKTDLRNKATNQVKQVMNELEKDTVIEQVLFTGFVIQ